MNNKLLIQSIALDLKRVVQGYTSHSEKTIDRFTQEALRWKNQIDNTSLSPQMQFILKRLEKILFQKNKKRLGDDALMYSTLLLQLSAHMQ